MIALVILAFTSCTPTLQEGKIENPKEATTVAIQHNVIDSCALLCVSESYIYIMNKDDNTVEYRLTPINNGYAIIKGWVVGVILILLIMLVYILITVWIERC